VSDQSRQDDFRPVRELLEAPGAGSHTASEEDVALGRLALERNLLTATQLSQLGRDLREARARGKTSSLGAIILSHGWMQPEDLLRLTTEQARQAASAPHLTRYEIRECLGEGASAVVYRAWDRELKRPVALKALRAAAGMSSVARSRFKREATAAANLVHPHVVTVYDAAEENGLSYLVMELIEGRTLLSILAEGKTPKKTLIGYLEQASRGVGAAHEKGIVHRDLKPANILVTAGGEAKVADFGLAHLMDSGSALTRSGAELGTPYYMSPEQVDGRSRESTPATDVYALGAILYEMLTGSPPHARPSLQETFAAILTQDPPPARSISPKIHADLETICQKALEKDPKRRYPNARQFADDLRAYLSGEFISAVPVPRWKRRLHRAIRNRILVTGVLLFLLAGAGAASMLIRQSVASQRNLASERDRARRRERFLQQLGTVQSTLLERDREIRQERIPAAQARRDLEAALAEVDRLVQNLPDFPQGYYVRARGKMLLDDLDGAERDLRVAVAKEPEFRPGWSVLGILKVGEYWSKLEGSPRSYDVRIQRLAPILEEAQTFFSRGWRPGKELEESVRWGLPWTREDQVIERLSRAFQLFYNDKNPAGAIALLEEGDKEYQAEEYSMWMGAFTDAGKLRTERLNEAVRRAPGYLVAYHIRAMYALQDRDCKTALSDLNRVLAIRTNSAYAWLNRGIAKKGLQDPEGAIPDLTRAIEINPRLESAWSHRGIAYALIGNKVESLNDFSRVVELDPSNAEGTQNRGVAKRLFGDFDGALEDFDRALQLNPNLLEALRERGAIYVDRRKYAEGIADLNKFIQRNPSVPSAFGSRGLARESTGDFAGAVRDYEEALRLAPANWPQRQVTEEFHERARSRQK
jgi:tetratricopeptide (TPR) repeat protein/tRNA A-37 threonylcarbamoyl transferase component Bud32